jgi:hypothetical protein
LPLTTSLLGKKSNEKDVPLLREDEPGSVLSNDSCQYYVSVLEDCILQYQCISSILMKGAKHMFEQDQTQGQGSMGSGTDMTQEEQSYRQQQDQG